MRLLRAVRKQVKKIKSYISVCYDYNSEMIGEDCPVYHKFQMQPNAGNDILSSIKSRGMEMRGCDGSCGQIGPFLHYIIPWIRLYGPVRLGIFYT